jgi:DNA-directed RNA polymerase specialized sigma24 family protein
MGRAQGLLGGLEREVISWFDPQGDRYPSAEEQAQIALRQAQQAQAETQQSQAETQQSQAETQQAQREAAQERQARLAAILHLSQIGLSPEQIADALTLPQDVVRARLSDPQ